MRLAVSHASAGDSDMPKRVSGDWLRRWDLATWGLEERLAYLADRFLLEGALISTA